MPFSMAYLKCTPAERQRRGENGDIALLETVDRTLVGIKADVFAVVGHIHLILVFSLEGIVGAVETVLENIGHGNELGRTALRHGVGRGAATAPAATDQRDLELVTPRRVNVGKDDTRQGRRGGELAGSFEKLPA